MPSEVLRVEDHAANLDGPHVARSLGRRMDDYKGLFFIIKTTVESL